MKATELRIGNYVMYEPTIDDWEEKVITLHSLLQVDISPESYCGIPLTEEWLLKFGFQEVELSIPRKWVIKNGFRLRENKLNKYFFQYKYGFVEVTQIHQLQNLYFALTGEELELT